MTSRLDSGNGAIIMDEGRTSKPSQPFVCILPHLPRFLEACSGLR